MKYAIALATLLAVVVGSHAWCWSASGEMWMPDQVKKDDNNKWCKCSNYVLTCGTCSAMDEVFDGTKNINGQICTCGQFGSFHCDRKRSLADNVKREFSESDVRGLMELLKQKSNE